MVQPNGKGSGVLTEGFKCSGN